MSREEWQEKRLPDELPAGMVLGDGCGMITETSKGDRVHIALPSLRDEVHGHMWALVFRYTMNNRTIARILYSIHLRGQVAVWIWCAVGALLTGSPFSRAQEQQMPSVRIESPVDGSVVVNTNSLEIRVAAEDPDGTVAKVALYRDGLFMAQALAAPYLFSVADLSAGTHHYSAVAIDNLGNRSVSGEVTVIVEAPLPPYFPPRVTLGGANDPLILTAPASLNLVATAIVYRDGLDRIDFEVRYEAFGPTPVVAGEGRLNPSALRLNDLAVGEYVFRAIVHDIYGSSTTSGEVHLTVVPPAGLRVPSFRLTDLGGLGGVESGAVALNEMGTVVGTSTVFPNSGEQRAYLWQGGIVRGFVYEGGFTQGMGLNDRGDVVGDVISEGRLAGAFLWTVRGGIRRLPALGTQSEALAVNRNGVVVGWDGGPNENRPVFWVPSAGAGSESMLVELSPGRYGQARAVNESGRIAGYVADGASGPSRAVIWEEGRERELGVTERLGGEWSQALGMNKTGNVVGQVGYAAPRRQGFVWRNGEVRQLTALVGSSARVVALNDRDWSVGWSDPFAPGFLFDHATLWLGEIPFDLNSLVTNRHESVLITADAVNDRGEIVGTFWTQGQRRGYLLTPTDQVLTVVPPIVELASPLVGASAMVGEPLNLLAGVTATDSAIARVDFYAGHTVVATAFTSPYTASWQPDTAGEICLRAVAIDSLGNSGASAPTCLLVDAARPRYALAHLGDLGERQARGTGMNSAGDFVGQARTDRGDVGFVFQSGVVTYFQSPGPVANEALGVNDGGQVLVWDNGRAGIYQKGVLAFLGSFPAGSPSSFGRAINRSGVVVGEGRTDSHETHAALFSGEAVTDLGGGLGEYSQANDINDLGVVVGWSQSAPGQTALSFVRQPDGTLLQFGSAFGGSIAQAMALNRDGIVVGRAVNAQSQSRAFVYGPDGMKPLGTLGGLTSTARDINGLGQIVGTAEDGNSRHLAFLYEHGAMIDLNRLLSNSAPVVLTEAVAINDAGQILANGFLGQDSTSPRVFLLNPLPPPGTSNAPPSVALQVPEGSSVFFNGDDILLRAAASDPDGAVALVLFTSGTNSLGSVTRPPYEKVWSNVAAGTYPVVATAFDTAGATRTSTVVAVTVRAFDASAPKVAIVGDASSAAVGDLRGRLRHTALFSRVDFLGSSPSSAELIAYDSVLVQSQSVDSLSSQMGDLLADYMDAGRGVVVALMASDASTAGLRGRIWREGYLAWTNGLVSGHGHGVLVKNVPDHPILSGVNDFDGGSSANYAQEVILHPGARTVASWNSGDPLAAVREFGAGRLVGLNLNPISQSISGTGWATNSDGARLLGNSLVWAASGKSNRFALGTLGTSQREFWPRQPISLAVDAPDLPKEGRVQFFHNGILLGTVTNLPSQFLWTNAPVGEHLLVATYTNAQGVSLATPGLPLTVDSRMTLSLLTPTNGAVYNLPTHLLMQVSVTNQDAAVVQVDYFLNETQRIGTVQEAPFSFDFMQVPTGTFTVSAVATDALGARRTSTPSRVTVFNSELPQVTEWKSADGEWSQPDHWTSGVPRAQDRALLDAGVSRITNTTARAASLVVGKNANASLVTTGGTLDLGSQGLFGENPGSTGNFQLYDPGAVTVGEWVLGLRGEGIVQHHGGRLIAEQLILSGNTGGTGTYALYGGQLTIRQAIVGGNGVGQFHHRGGIHQVTSLLQVGNRIGSVGSYNLSGGALTAEFESIGSSGSSLQPGSTLLQTGGFHTVREELRVGEFGATGRLSVSGGVLQTTRLVLESSRLELVADPATNRVRVLDSARLGGILDVRLVDGFVPLGGDMLTLMTYGSRVGEFAVTNLPPSTNGVRWSLEYREKSLVLRALPPIQVVIVSGMNAQPEPGLFHQTVILSNLGGEELRGSRIYFPGLPTAWQVYNAAGTEEGVPYVEVDALIPAGTSIQFTVQFLVPGEIQPSRQNYVVRLGEVSRAGATALPLEIERVLRLPDEAVQLQFSTGRNQAYQIEYSEDLIEWRLVPQPVMATGSQSFWLDDGPPKTIRAPASDTSRYYRVSNGASSQ